MLIKTRRDLPATAWLQTRSSFWLAIAQHPFHTGLHSLSWLGSSTLHQLRSPRRTKILSRFLGASVLVGAGTLALTGLLGFPQDPARNPDVIQKPVSAMVRPLSKAEAIRAGQVITQWQVPGRMWQTMQDQWVSQQAAHPVADPGAIQKALASSISTEYHIAPAAAQNVVSQAYEVARVHQVDPVLLLAVVGVESRFNPLAGSNAGAVGLVQALARAHPDKVSPVLARGGSLTDVRTNLNLGAQILKEYMDLQHGNTTRALQAYKGSLNDPSQSYARTVLAVKARFDRAVTGRSAPVSTPVRPVKEIARARQTQSGLHGVRQA